MGGEGGRHLVKVRGDKAHPSSRGYACEKPHRLDHYQNGADRLRSPLLGRPMNHSIPSGLHWGPTDCG